MAQISRAQMEILVKAVDQASGVLKDIGKETENMEKKAVGLSKTMQAALGAISAYAGSQGIMALVRASEEGNLQLAKARVYLSGNVKDVESSLAAHQKWATTMQKAIGVGDEYATMVASKLSPRYKQLSKQQEYANILLRGERLQLFNAADAAFNMSKNQESMERTLRWLLDTMGVATPAFVSMDTLWAEINKKITEGEKGLSGYRDAVAILKENLGEFAERAGTPLVRFFATIIGYANELIDRFPIVGDIISGAMAVIATALTGLGIGMGISSLLGLLGISTAFGPWGLAIGAAIGFVVYYLSQLQGMSEDTKRKWQMIMVALTAASAIAAVAINAAFFLPLALMFAALAIITSMSIEGYKLSWQGFKDYMRDTFVGIGIIIKETWTATLQWLKDQFNGFSDWISNKVQEIMAAVSRAISAVSSLPGVSSVVSAAKSAVSAVAGKRASGGPVSAGLSYVVGERGPEVFTPRTSGTIIPNGGGGGIIVDMRGSTFIDRQAAVEIGNEIIMRLRELHRLSTS